MAKKVLNVLFIKTAVEFYVFWLGYFAMTWVLPLLFNPSLLSIQGFEIYRDINPNYLFWAFVYFLIGIIGIGATIIKRKPFTQLACVLLTALWIFTATSFTVAVGFNTGTMIYGTFAAVSLWNLVRSYNYSYQSWM